MALSRVNEFIRLYQSEPDKSLEWLKKTNMDLKTLFIQSSEVTQLAAAHQALAKARPDAVAELDQPIDSLLEVAGTQIARLYQSFDELSALNEANPALAFVIFTYAPEHIASLLQFAGQFLKLYKDNQALALQVFENAKTQIAAFFTLPEQFSALEEANPLIAQEVLQQVANKTTTGSSLPPLREQQDPASAPADHSFDRQAGHTNYSFYLKALGALTAIITGAGAIIAAWLISQPVVAIAGICLGVAGIAGLGFFAVKGRVVDENASNEHSNMPVSVPS